MKKILVIDGNSIINRAFYGVKPLTTKTGKFTNAIFGMINIISRQLTALKPDYAAVAFDLKHPTFRHEMYSEYKAGRKETPEELRSQFPDAKECLRLMGLHILEMPGYEADDLQGTVAKMAHLTDDTESYILSGDRDLLQLIDPKVTVLLATNSDTVVMKREQFFEKYGIEPTEFVDMKALMGDSSDNIPGVGGVGEKTAAALIQNFASLDGIYENIDDKRISKGVREKLLRDKEQAYLSKKLAQIETRVPVEFKLNDLEYHGFDEDGLYEKFTELELVSLIAKFGLKKSATARGSSEEKKNCDLSGDKKNSNSESAEYKAAIAEEINAIPEMEISLQLKEEDGIFVSAGEKNLCFCGELSCIAKSFEGKTLICYDAKAVLHKLYRAGCDIRKVSVKDLMLYAYVLNPGGGNGAISSLCSMFLGQTPSEDEPTAHLYEGLESALFAEIKRCELERVLLELELPLVGVLTEIEINGFKIDPDGIREFGTALSELAQDLQTKIYFQAGKEFNLNSPKQLAEVLYVDLGLPSKKKKGKSGYSTDAETLEELRPYSQIIDDILEYRQVTKLNNTYAQVLPQLVDEKNRIHTDLKQALTATGRLSSTDPNLQNIPIRTKMGREMRRYFIADDGYSLVDADYSQIELRLLAHISDDYNMIESFKAGADIHRKTAAAVFGIPEEAVNDEMRKSAKAVNFGIVYGISGFSLAKDIGTSVSEATKYIKSYLMNYPSVDRYLEQVVEKAKEDGYTKTLFGRRRYIPELVAQNATMKASGKRVAMNAPIQGAAADIMKLAMINVYKRLISEGLDARIVMQVHDELIIEVKDEEVEMCKAIVKEEMEGVMSLSVPLTVDVTSGKNWLEQS